MPQIVEPGRREQLAAAVPHGHIVCLDQIGHQRGHRVWMDRGTPSGGEHGPDSNGDRNGISQSQPPTYDIISRARV
jgi:hypothetical protein